MTYKLDSRNQEGWLADLQDLPLHSVVYELETAKKQEVQELALLLGMSLRDSNGLKSKAVLAAECYEYLRNAL